MKSLTLKEAWDYLNNKYTGIPNVYDAYVSKQDWMKSIDDIEAYNSISLDLLEIEGRFGITKLRDQIMTLYDKVSILELPAFGYKYTIPADIENEVKLKLREAKQEIKENEEKLEYFINTIQVDAEILHLEN